MGREGRGKDERVLWGGEGLSDEGFVVESDSEDHGLGVSVILGVDLVSGSEEADIIRRNEEADAAVRTDKDGDKQSFRT
jgi:hypothetical protein